MTGMLAGLRALPNCHVYAPKNVSFLNFFLTLHVWVDEGEPPDQVFFHTDFVRFRRADPTGASSYADGNPHPPRYQRLVPGMENFTVEHLVPQLVYVITSDGKVMDQVISQQPAESEDPQARRGVLDDAIHQLQEQQDQQARGQQGTPRRVSLSEHIEVQSPPTVDLQCSGQVEGAHQMHQNAPCSQMETEMDLQVCCRGVVPDLTTSAYRDQEPYRIVKGEEDITFYNAKKQTIEHSTFRDDSDDETPCTNRAKPRKWHRNFKNSLIEFSCEEGEDTASSEDNENEASEEDSSNEDEEKEWRSDSSSPSSGEYWTVDAGITTQAAMSSHVCRQIRSSDEDEEEEDNRAENDQTEQTQDEDAQFSSPQKLKRKEKSETPKEQLESPTPKSPCAKASTADNHRNKKQRQLNSTYSSMKDSSASSLSGTVNGFSSRSSRAKRRRVCDSSSSDLECSEDEENPANANNTDQNRQPRKGVVAAVSKMKLMHASEEEDTSEHKPAVIQSSSEPEEHDDQDDSPCQ